MIRRAAGRLPVAVALTGALAGALVTAPAVVAAQDAPPAVRIDVVVSSRGAAVPVLDARAFTITVNGTPREVIAAEPAVAPGTGRTFYLAIDETSVFRGAEASLRTVASAIADRLAPGDRLGVVLLPQARPALPPTDDAAAIEKALAGITGRRPNDFGNFDMGVGEALGNLGERHLRPDRGGRPRLPDAGSAPCGGRLAGGAGQPGRAEPAPRLHPAMVRNRRGDDAARPRLRRRRLPRPGQSRRLAP